MESLRGVKRLELEATLRALRANEQEGPHEVEVCGRLFGVEQGVFSPKHFTDTQFFAREVAAVVAPDEDFAEVGCGSGVISCLVAEKQRDNGTPGRGTVLAGDINPAALKTTRQNAVRHGVQDRVQVVYSDVYSGFGESRRALDTIFWNTPFAWVPKDHHDDQWNSSLAAAVIDPGYEKTEIFVKQAGEYLRNRRRLLIGFSSTLGEIDLLMQILWENHYLVKQIAQEESQEGGLPVTFELFQAHQRLRGTPGRRRRSESRRLSDV